MFSVHQHHESFLHDHMKHIKAEVPGKTATFQSDIITFPILGIVGSLAYLP